MTAKVKRLSETQLRVLDVLTRDGAILAYLRSPYVWGRHGHYLAPVTRATADVLIANGYVALADTSIIDYRITDAGRAALATQQPPAEQAR